jgi:hypothetical protein
MKKIRLNLDRIAVESFQTANVPAEAGTVEAHLRSRPGDTFCGDCTLNSCDEICQPTKFC